MGTAAVSGGKHYGRYKADGKSERSIDASENLSSISWRSLLSWVRWTQSSAQDRPD